MTCDVFFIVGMPRSGTKLLRDLLNLHSHIGIPEAETHFIPFLVKKYGAHPVFDRTTLRNIFTDISGSTFFMEITPLQQRVTEDFFVENDFSSWSELFLYVLSKCVPGKQLGGHLFGDKTPGYVNHLPLLQSIFPEAKFIHIVRDPRDYCLSVQKTWKKSVYRAAEQWRDSLARSRKDSKKIGANYVEISYENLLEDHEAILQQLCIFLGVTFESEMLFLQKPSECYGDAKGEVRVVKNNMNKFRTRLSNKKIKRIEEITYPMMLEMHYEIIQGSRFRPLTKLEKSAAVINDLAHSISFHAKDKGLVAGLKYFFNHHSKSSWHN